MDLPSVRIPWILVGAVVLATTGADSLAGPASAAEAPATFCSRTGTDDITRPIPTQLVPAANAALGTRMPEADAVAATVFRCVDRRVAICTVGANLNCGKANQSRTPGPGAVEWCQSNPEADFVPAFAVGHDTIYAWACHRGEPRIDKQVSQVDSRGFVAENWKVLPKGK